MKGKKTMKEKTKQMMGKNDNTGKNDNWYTRFCLDVFHLNAGEVLLQWAASSRWTALTTRDVFLSMCCV